MYTEEYGARRRKRRRPNVPGIIVACILILFFLFIIGKAVGILRDLFGSGSALWETEPSAAVQEDALPPEIFGVQDMTVYQGDTVAYRKGVSVTDGEDPEPILEVDASGVDLTVPGSYTVVYIGTDAAGNQTKVTAAVTVLPRKAGYVELETIGAAADALLEEITWPGATAREQVFAIYGWAQSHISYGGRSDREDWYQTAYTVIQEKRGDCYGYFAVTKLLLERLGIDNIDVVKVKNDPEDSEHFWSLVSIDGGEHYYHFDATPRQGEGDDFCMVTDAFLDAYSWAHNNCHNRDKSLYPATPEEDLL